MKPGAGAVRKPAGCKACIGQIIAQDQKDRVETMNSAEDQFNFFYMMILEPKDKMKIMGTLLFSTHVEAFYVTDSVICMNTDLGGWVRELRDLK